jgi:hypothetical protein
LKEASGCYKVKETTSSRSVRTRHCPAELGIGLIFDDTSSIIWELRFKKGQKSMRERMLCLPPWVGETNSRDGKCKKDKKSTEDRKSIDWMGRTDDALKRYPIHHEVSINMCALHKVSKNTT